MPLDSIVCRKNLDEERGNPWICECPLCNVQRELEEKVPNELRGSLSTPDLPLKPESLAT
jgi:hypothetical protein